MPEHAPPSDEQHAADVSAVRLMCGNRNWHRSPVERDQDLFVWRGIDRLCVGPWDGQLKQHSGQKNLRQFIKRSFIK